MLPFHFAQMGLGVPARTQYSITIYFMTTMVILQQVSLILHQYTDKRNGRTVPVGLYKYNSRHLTRQNIRSKIYLNEHRDQALIDRWSTKLFVRE
jgi:hypothetical protein